MKFKGPLSKNLRFLALLALFVSPALAAREIDTPAGQDREESYFGLNGTKIFHIPGEPAVEERFGFMEDLGVYWDRIDLWWHVVEPEPGTWDYSRADYAFEAYEDHGVQWYPILCYGAAWWEGHNAPLTDEHVADFAEYVYKTVDRFQDRVTYWAVWNEANIPNFWAPAPDVEVYYELLKATHEAATRADPDVKLGAPVLAPLGEWDRKFTERLFQLGGHEYFDVFDYHYYRNHPPEREVPREIAEIKALMERYGGQKPIWISESGVSSPNDNVEENYPRQASLVVRNQLLALALGVERFFYFDLQNWRDNDPEEWDSQLGLVEADGDKKPSFHAYQTMVKEVDYREVVGRYTKLGEGVEAVVIHGPAASEVKLAAWLTDDDAAREVQIITEPRDIRIVQPSGEFEMIPLEIPRAPGQETRTITVKIDRHPRYIHNVDPHTYLPEAAFQIDPPMAILAPGEESRMEIDIYDAMPGGRWRARSVDTPDGITWDVKEGVVRCDETLPEGVYELEAVIEAEYEDEYGRKKQPILRKTAFVEIISTLDLSLRPVREDGKLKAVVTLSNQTRSELPGRLELAWLNGDQESLLVEQEIDPIRAGENRRISLDAELPLSGLEGTGAWTARFGDFESRPFRVYTAAFSENGPEIDGDLSDWQGVPSLFIGRQENITRTAGVEWTKENASADVHSWFTPDAIYFAAEVTDNSPMVNDNAPKELWKGDAFELYLGLQGPTARSTIDKSFEYQIGVAPKTAETGPVAFWFHQDEIIEGAEVATEETESGYRIEARIPLAAIGSGDIELKAGDFVGLDVALDDVDEEDWAPAGNLPGRALVWNGTGQNWIDPSNWGLGVLVKK